MDTLNVTNEGNKVKLLIISFILLCQASVMAYDITIKDKYGRTQGYLDTKGNKTYFVDKYGRREGFITNDGVIKDKYGRTQGKVKRTKK